MARVTLDDVIDSLDKAKDAQIKAETIRETFERQQRSNGKAVPRRRRTKKTKATKKTERTARENVRKSKAADDDRPKRTSTAASRRQVSLDEPSRR